MNGSASRSDRSDVCGKSLGSVFVRIGAGLQSRKELDQSKKVSSGVYIILVFYLCTA